jgi:hypothetical protein
VKSAAGALHLGIFDHPEKNEFFNRLNRPDAEKSEPFERRQASEKGFGENCHS